jgi:hypothetical protein
MAVVLAGIFKITNKWLLSIPLLLALYFIFFSSASLRLLLVADLQAYKSTHECNFLIRNAFGV